MTTTATTTRRTCAGTPRPRRTPKPATPEDILRSEITAICEQIDRRNGTTPGTAERGIYFWFWPRTDDLATLTALHADAVTYLANLIEGKTE